MRQAPLPRPLLATLLFKFFAVFTWLVHGRRLLVNQLTSFFCPLHVLSLLFNCEKVLHYTISQTFATGMLNRARNVAPLLMFVDKTGDTPWPSHIPQHTKG